MPFKPLAAIACLAPLPAAAFGDLDCIATQSCGNSGCFPVSEPFGVTFDWANDAVTVSVAGTNHILPWVQTDTSTDGLASELEYGDMDDINHLLRIRAAGTSITARYTFRSPRVTTWDATCDVRQAA